MTLPPTMALRVARIAHQSAATSRRGSVSRGFLSRCALALVSLLGPLNAARAYDVEVESDTTFRAYEVQSNVARVFWTRRRLIQRLSLELVLPIARPDPFQDRAPPGQGDPGLSGWWSTPRPPRLWARIRAVADLRFDQEFGDTCLVRERDRCLVLTDSGFRAAYEPLVAQRAISLPALYVEADRLPLDARVRAGRQTLWDPIGFARTDGLAVRLAPVPWASLEGSYGFLVRFTSFGGRDSYVPDGVPRLDRPLRDRETAQIEGPAPARLLTLSAGLGDVRIARLGVHFRNLRDRTGLLQREAAASLTSVMADPLRVDAHGVFDARHGDLVDGQAELALRARQARLRLRLRRQVPRFDYGSIWAFFVTAPQWQASLGADASLGQRLQLGGDLRARRMDADRDARQWDVGGQARLGWAVRRLRGQVSGVAWGGDLGSTWGMRTLLDYRLESFMDVFGEVSAYRIEGISAGLDPATSLGLALGASLRLAKEARGQVELSHAYSRTVGHRVALLAHLQIGAWR